MAGINLSEALKSQEERAEHGHHAFDMFAIPEPIDDDVVDSSLIPTWMGDSGFCDEHLPEWQRAEGQLGGVPGQGGAVGSSLLQHAEDGLATGQPGQPLRVWLPAGRGLLQRGVGLHS